MSDLIYSQASASLAHTSGNMTSIILDYYKSLFPKNFFKTTNISTKIAFKHFQNLKDFVELKKSKPILAFQPRIILDEADYLTKSYFMHKVYDNFDSARPSYHNTKFFNDYNKELFMEFMVNRIKMSFEVSMIFETSMQQANVVNYIMNSVRMEKPFFIQRIIESQIPGLFIKQLSSDSGIPIFDENGSILNFMDYLNRNSKTPMVYKMKYSSGNNEFFIITGTSISMIVSRPNIDDGERKGFTTDNFMITQTIEVEFNYPGLFYYVSKNVQDIIEDNKDNITADMLLKTEIIPLFTIQTNVIPKSNNVGWELLVSCQYNVTDENSDVLEIKNILNNKILKVIDYNNKNGINNNVFFELKLYKNDIPVDPNMYSVDFENLTLINGDCDLESTYRITIYYDNLYINSLILSS